MDNLLNLIIGMVFAFGSLYLLIFHTRELAVLLHLHFRGESTEAILVSVFTKVGIGRSYRYAVYHYKVFNSEYQHIRVRGISLFEDLSRITIDYSPKYPEIVRYRHSSLMHVGQMLFYTAFGLTWATILTIFRFVSPLMAYSTWLILIVTMVIFPKVIMNSTLIYLCDPRIPKYVVKEEI